MHMATVASFLHWACESASAVALNSMSSGSGFLEFLGDDIVTEIFERGCDSTDEARISAWRGVYEGTLSGCKPFSRVQKRLLKVVQTTVRTNP